MEKSSRLNKSISGFSLVELMVTVATIGVLAAIAIPNYKKSRMKAYQAEAKVQLAGIYTAEQSFYFEYNSYYSSLKAIGYAPYGRLRYNVGFASYGTLTPDNFTAITPDVQMSTKEICSGAYGAGSDANCNMIVSTPDLDATNTVYSTFFTAGAVAYDQILTAQQDSGSPFDRIANLLLSGSESQAMATLDPLTDECADQSLSSEGWNIDQNKKVSYVVRAGDPAYVRPVACDLYHDMHMRVRDD